MNNQSDEQFEDDMEENWKFLQRWKQQERLIREESGGKLRVHNRLKDCHYYCKSKNPKYAVICIPGRANDGAAFAFDYFNKCISDDIVFVGPTPIGYAWYPMPISPSNQFAALSGLPLARKVVRSVIDAVMQKFKIPQNHIALTGFSAGGVMAVQTASHSEEPFHSVVVHNGAILEPADLPPCPNATPYMLIHNQDDFCFDWNERYIPMKNALMYQNYPLSVIEKRDGGHWVLREDFEQGLLFMHNHGMVQNGISFKKDYETI